MMREMAPAAKWSCFHIILLGCLWAGCGIMAGQKGSLSSFEMKMIYKYSEEFREQMRGKIMVSDWPRYSTAEFYHEIALHDRHRHASRNLLTDVYSLFPSNTTQYFSTMGGLHYTFILLGTPAQAFVVALDTGSDLLWVPCDCQQCSTANWTAYGIDVPVEFAIYSPSNSTTSKSVACNEAVCSSTLNPGACDASQSCTYSAKYLSANTSSSGTIVQDVIYLNSETNVTADVASEIYVGCGKLQTGDFLDGGAPNGLFGLGPEVYSVPTTFARNGITKNVFSMCFSKKDGSGRLIFGRKPAASLQNTPIIPILPSVYYVLAMEGFVAGGMRLNVTQRVVFDTGTSLTIFPSNVVKAVGDALSSAYSLQSFPFTIQTISFSHCWNITTNAEVENLPSLSIVFSGGGLWTINGPLLRVTDRLGNMLFVCLGILSSNSSSTPPIFGFNFMGNYEYFFDQETSTFSWGPSDCSGTNDTSTAVMAPSMSPDLMPVSVDSAPAPAKTAAAPKSSTSPDNLLPPAPSLSSEASSISFQPLPLVLLISSTFFLLLSK